MCISIGVCVCVPVVKIPGDTALCFPAHLLSAQVGRHLGAGAGGAGEAARSGLARAEAGKKGPGATPSGRWLWREARGRGGRGGWWTRQTNDPRGRGVGGGGVDPWSAGGCPACGAGPAPHGAAAGPAGSRTPLPQGSRHCPARRVCLGPAESNQGLLRAAFRPGGPRRLLSPSYTSAAGGSPGLGLPALASQLDYRLRAPTPGPP